MKKVLDICRKSFRDSIDAIDGTCAMTPDILNSINCIFDAKVPNNFMYDSANTEISWLLPTLGLWFTSL